MPAEWQHSKVSQRNVVEAAETLNMMSEQPGSSTVTLIWAPRQQQDKDEQDANIILHKTAQWLANQ